jgi:phosphoserine phosphatase RsbU/P
MDQSFLLVSHANLSAKVYQLSAQRHVIGRRPDAEIVIDQGAVSWSHAILELGPSGRWWILDLDSTNGTFVNGVRVTERLLSRGDVIRIGDCTLVLRLASVMAFPSPLAGAQDGPRTGRKNTLGGFESVDKLAAARPAQTIGAEQLASIMSFGRDLMRLEGADARLKALCEFVAGDLCFAIGVTAIRINASGQIRPIWTAAARGSERLLGEFEPSAVRELINRREPLIVQTTPPPDPASRSSIRMLIPFAEVDCSIDALLAEFPPRYGTQEWLMLITLVAEAYQQAEMVWDMRHQVRQNAFVEGELEMACQIQKGLVPKQFCAPGLELAFGFEPCRWVGGDYVDALMLPDGRVLLAIADVCGKGMQAALVASSVHTLVRASRDLCGDLPLLMKHLNEYLLGHLPEHSFVTMLCILLNCQTGEFELVSAGHPAAIIVRSGICSEILGQTDNVGLGIVPEDFVTLSSQLDVGDVLLMYTDGLTEMVNTKDEPFGTERLATEFQRIVDINPLAPVDSMRERLIGLCNAYRGSRMATDDRTFLVATRRTRETIRPPASM